MRIKKIILFLLVMVMMLCVCNPVSAATSYSVELLSSVESVQQGQEITITLKVKDIVEIADGVGGLSAKLEYDTSKLEKVGNGQGLNGFMIVEGNTIQLAKGQGVTGDTELAKFVFKATATGEAQVKLTNVEVGNGTDMFPLGKEVTKTITITAANTPPVDDPTNDPADPPSGQLSNNSYLSSLSVDGTTISNFNKETLTYTLSAVENNKASIEISAKAEDEKAKVTGTGKKELKVGKNTFEIVVKAEDETEKTYKIEIERKAEVPKGNEEKKDQYQEKIPHAGVGSYLIIGVIFAVTVVAIISFIKTRKLRGI